ncbi:MAG: acyl carrier protein, partial [Dolichospermum sp.]
MSVSDKSYELKILKMIVNKHLDESTLFNKENINESETKRDQFVWDTATKIYQQSGHKVELSLVRDIVDSRIRAIKNQLAEEARPIANTEKAQEFLSKVTDVLGKFGGDERKAKVFVRVRELISEQLSVEEREVTLDSHLSNHLNADEDDVLGIMMVLEEEFDIEIPDEVAEKSLGIG